VALRTDARRRADVDDSRTVFLDEFGEVRQALHALRLRAGHQAERQQQDDERALGMLNHSSTFPGEMDQRASRALTDSATPRTVAGGTSPTTVTIVSGSLFT